MASREEPQLFDFPLDPEPPRRRRPGRSREASPEEPSTEASQSRLPFATEELEEPEEVVFEGEDRDEEAAPSLGARLLAAVTDLGVHLAVVVLAVAGIVLAGIAPRWEHGFALALLLLPFSFIYTVVPLAFWGQTPGMAWRELRSCNRDGDSLTAAQAVLRWLGGLTTLALAGLPALLVLTGRSLPDRLSGSETLWTEPSDEGEE